MSLSEDATQLFLGEKTSPKLYQTVGDAVSCWYRNSNRDLADLPGLKDLVDWVDPKISCLVQNPQGDLTIL